MAHLFINSRWKIIVNIFSQLNLTNDIDFITDQKKPWHWHSQCQSIRNWSVVSLLCFSNPSICAINFVWCVTFYSLHTHFFNWHNRASVQNMSTQLMMTVFGEILSHTRSPQPHMGGIASVRKIPQLDSNRMITQNVFFTYY